MGGGEGGLIGGKCVTVVVFLFIVTVYALLGKERDYLLPSHSSNHIM